LLLGGLAPPRILVGGPRPLYEKHKIMSKIEDLLW
jgi:hypothetical protein